MPYFHYLGIWFAAYSIRDCAHLLSPLVRISHSSGMILAESNKHLILTRHLAKYCGWGMIGVCHEENPSQPLPLVEDGRTTRLRAPTHPTQPYGTHRAKANWPRGGWKPGGNVSNIERKLTEPCSYLVKEELIGMPLGGTPRTKV